MAIGIKWRHKVKLYYVLCQSCSAKTAYSQHKEEAVAFWNSRYTVKKRILDAILSFFTELSIKEDTHEE